MVMKPLVGLEDSQTVNNGVIPMEPERGSVRPFAIFFQTIITMVTARLLEEKAFYKGWGGGAYLIPNSTQGLL